MKKIVAAVALTLAFAVSAIAADSVVYPAKNGNVTFNHKAHSTKFECKACHEGAPAKIAINKDAAHGKSCKGCHAEKNGPTKCGDCHKK